MQPVSEHVHLFTHICQPAALLHGNSFSFFSGQSNTNEYKRLTGASVGIAFPADRNQYGYISEVHAYGKDEREIGDFAEDLASTMLATTLGVEFDPDKDYDERQSS